MTGATTPCPAETGSQALPCRSALPGLEAIVKHNWSEVVPRPDPRLRASLEQNTPLPQSLAARLQILAPAESGLTTFLEGLESVLRSQRAASDSFDVDDEIDVDMPLGLAPIGAPQAHMQALVRDFSRRQRQATMLVTGCVATSCVLTVVGIAALASLTPQAGRSEDRLRDRSNAVAWEAPAPDAPALTLTSASLNRSGKSDSLFVFARLAAAEPPRAAEEVRSGRRASAPELILMQPGRPVSLAPLIAPRRASYVLIRGLPGEATLSAGTRSPSGAWLVKAAEIESLTLSIDGTVSGDYTAEIYAVGAQALPQGRQRVVFRVESAFGRTAADGFNWAATLRDMAMTHEANPSGVSYERISDAGDTVPRRMKILASLSD